MCKNDKIENTAVIILAAGNSTRMGAPKAFLKWDDENTFLEHIIFSYFNFGCKNICVVLNNETMNMVSLQRFLQIKNITFIGNKFPERERFYSLKLGVNNLQKCNAVFIHNVDNPFVKNEVLDKLIINSGQRDVIKPVFQGKSGHPILINKNVISALHDYTGDIDNIKDFISNYLIFKCDVASSEILINIDDIEEYKKHFKISSKVL